MNMFYSFLIYLHIVSVIASIGPFFALIPIARKLRTAENEVQKVYLDFFRFGVRLTKHAGHVLVGTGILLVILGPWSWTTSWIDITILIMASSLYFLARAFSPTFRKFSEEGSDREQLARKLSSTTLLYILLLLIMLWFMVAKPALW